MKVDLTTNLTDAGSTASIDATNSANPVRGATTPAAGRTEQQGTDRATVSDLAARLSVAVRDPAAAPPPASDARIESLRTSTMTGSLPLDIMTLAHSILTDEGAP